MGQSGVTATMHGKTIVNIVIVLTALASLTALAVSVYPGVLNDLPLTLVLLSLPVIGSVALTVLIVLACKGKLRGPQIPWRRVVAVFSILLATYVLLKFYVPRRIAFAASRSAFDALVEEASGSGRQGAILNERLGVYRVDEYAVDTRGGVYFRVYRGWDGLGPDTMSYGFAHKPNKKGTPFGAARYRVFRLGDNWHWFRASNDWY